MATASTGQATYAPGATVSIQGSASNRGTGPCILKGGGPPLTWTIRNAAGQEVVQLAHAAMIWADRAVQPGESVPLTTSWDQRTCVDTCAQAPPGTYTLVITWTFEVGTVGASSSFTVTE
ncbi:MAG: hypothetical protein ACRD12_11995 [Acidimicrobiales bacterium]